MKITFTSEQRKQFDEWSKEDIYIAYISENRARKAESERANEHARELKELKWKMKQIIKNLDLES